MEVYKEQFEPWQPANPPVWNHLFKDQIIDLSCKPENSKLININLCAFFDSRNSINRAMRS